MKLRLQRIENGCQTVEKDKVYAKSVKHKLILTPRGLQKAVLGV